MTVSPQEHEDYDGFSKEQESDDFEDDYDEEEPEAQRVRPIDPGVSRTSSREFEEPELPWADNDYVMEEPQRGESAEDEYEDDFARSEELAREDRPAPADQDEGVSRASSREFGEPNLPWTHPDTVRSPPDVEGKKEEPAQDSPGGSLGSSREFEEPNLPWAEEGWRAQDQVDNERGHTAQDDYEDDFARTATSFYQRQETQRLSDCTEGLADALRCFKQGDYETCMSLARKTKEVCQEQTYSGLRERESDQLLEENDAGDAWRAAMDLLAAAHEGAADVERAEALYLRMLCWREGAEQFEAGNFNVSQLLFQKSSTYRSVEDATWFLHTVRPEDGHMGSEATALLSLGEEVAAKAAIAVWTLALQPGQRQALTAAGALELTAKAIAFHGSNAELMAAGCGTLRLLCVGHPLAHWNRRRLIFLGAAEAALQAMRSFPEDCEVMREACGALRAMAHKNPVGARRIIENDGFKHFLEALEHMDDSVSSMACKAIGAIQCAAEVDFQSSDAQAENLQAVWEARLREEREAGLKNCCEKLRGPLTHGVLEAVLGTICILMEDPVRYKFLKILQPVVVCMQMFPGNEKIQVPSCKILLSLTSSGSLSNEHEEAIQKLAKSGGIGPLVQAMKDLPCNLLLQRLAIAVLRNFLTAGDMNKTSAARAGAIPAMIMAMQRYKRNLQIQEEAIACLTALCDTLGRASVAARLGLIDCALGAVKRQNYGLSSGKITERCCMMLCMFADDQKLRQDIVNAGALNVAKQIISRATNLDVQRWGCELLRSLSQPV